MQHSIIWYDQLFVLVTRASRQKFGFCFHAEQTDFPQNLSNALVILVMLGFEGVLFGDFNELSGMSINWFGELLKLWNLSFDGIEFLVAWVKGGLFLLPLWKRLFETGFELLNQWLFVFKLFVELVDYFLVFNEGWGKVLNLLGLLKDVSLEMLLLE